MQQDVSASAAELARMSELIDSIYQCATEPNHWNMTLSQIVNWLDASKGMLFTPLVAPPNGGYYFSHAIPDAMMQIWSTKYENKDLWSIRGFERGLAYEGAVAVSEELATTEEYRSSEWYHVALAKYDIAFLLYGVIFGNGTPSKLQTPVTVFSLYRGHTDQPFSPEQRDRLKLLVPHLSRSLGVMTRLKDMELRIASSLSALDRLTVGVLLFDVHGAVSFANRAARRILEEEDGLRLRHLSGNSSLGQVVAEEDRVTCAIASAVSSAVSPDILNTEHFSRAVLVPRPSGRQEYTLNFSSLAEQNEFGTGSDTPRAIAFITDLAVPVKLDAELLKKTYGLTPAEVRLAKLMAECMTVDETADKLCVSPHTVKTHLMSIYSKTNVDNRAKLMRLIMSLAQITS